MKMSQPVRITSVDSMVVRVTQDGCGCARWVVIRAVSRGNRITACVVRVERA